MDNTATSFQNVLHANRDDRLYRPSYSEEASALALAAESMAKVVSSNYRKISKFLGKNIRTFELGKEKVPSLITKVKKHRDSLFKASANALLSSFQVDHQIVSRFNPPDTYEGEEEIDQAKSASEILLRANAIHAFAQTAKNHDQTQNTVEYSYPKVSTKKIAQFASNISNHVAKIAETVLISNRLYAQTIADNASKAAKFFLPGTKIFGLGKGWLANHRKLATGVTLGLGAVAAGVTLFGSHLGGAEIAEVISNAASFIQHASSGADTLNHISNIASSQDSMHINILHDQVSSALNIPAGSHGAQDMFVQHAAYLGDKSSLHSAIQTVSSQTVSGSDTSIVRMPSSQFTITGHPAPEVGNGAGMSVVPDTHSSSIQAAQQHTTHARSNRVISDLKSGQHPAYTAHLSAADKLNQAELDKLARTTTNTANRISSLADQNRLGTDHTPNSTVLSHPSTHSATQNLSAADRLNQIELDRLNGVKSSVTTSQVTSGQSAVGNPITQSVVPTKKPEVDGWAIGRAVARKMAENHQAVPNIPAAPIGVSPVANGPSVVDHGLLDDLESLYRKR